MILREVNQMLKLYGYSDDIITIERDGKPEEELDAYDLIVTIWFDDHTGIEIGYSKPGTGIWFIRVIGQGSAKQHLTVCEDENAEIYSDVFEINAEIRCIIPRPFDGGVPHVE